MRVLIKKNTLYIVFSAVYMFFAGTLEWIFALRGNWFAVSAFAPPAWIYLTIWILIFASFSISLAIVLIKRACFNLLVLTHLLNGALCAFYAYLFFYSSHAANALLLCAVMFFISFFLFKYTLDFDELAAILLLPYVLWLAVILAFSYYTVLFGSF